MHDTLRLLNDNSTCTKKLEELIDYKFQQFYDFFSNQSNKQLLVHKYEIESYLHNNLKVIRQLNLNIDSNLNFLLILIRASVKIELYMLFQTLFNVLRRNNYCFDKKIAAQSLYIVDVGCFDDYLENHQKILDVLNEAFLEEEESKFALTAVCTNLYLRLLNDFGEFNKADITKFKSCFINSYESRKYKYIDRIFLDGIFNIDISDYKNAYRHIQNLLFSYTINNTRQTCTNNEIFIETSNYSSKLYSIPNLTFDKIRNISIDHITAIGKNRELYNRLDRGRFIIDDEVLLYQYILSYGKMHKAKLYEAFDTIICELDNIKINIIDWGCGQALATTLLIEHIREKKYKVDIEKIKLIEPSPLALSRGYLHVDSMQQNQHSINAINKDLDSLDLNDIAFNDNNTVLHLFSNILDMDCFKLDINFLERISTNIKSNNIFVCVSPNINSSRNSRLDIFHKYFDNNFNTKLISDRCASINAYKRYEKIFKVTYSS